MHYLELAAGLLLLILGGDALVRGAVALAWRLGVSPMLIGLTLVGFGTSTPELLTSIEAALVGAPGIAVGNVVGSNICNILLILGLAALIQPIRTAPRSVWQDGSVALFAALACTVVVFMGQLGTFVGAVLVALLVAYLVGACRRERGRVVPHAEAAERENAPSLPLGVGFSASLTIGGLALTMVGAHFLVDGSITLARTLGTSETLIGLTVVAVGTSLPELVTSVVASVRRQGDVAFGNVVGSNIFNVFGILGLTALVHPIPVPTEIARLDVWVMIAATVALIVFSLTGNKLTRTEGGILLTAYSAYVAGLVYAA